MARLTRKELKSDKFAVEVGHTVDFFEEHRNDIIRYGAALIVLVVVIFAVSMYRSHQHDIREQALADAILAQEAPVGGAAQGTPLWFQTPQDKANEANKRFTSVATKFSGSDEATIAEYYLGAIALDQGKFDEAERHYKTVVDKGDSKYASLAKLALAQLQFAQGHSSEGEQLLRDLIANPTIFVSKEQATMVLARELAKTKPEEAKKLIEPLRTSNRAAVSQSAINLYAELTSR